MKLFLRSHASIDSTLYGERWKKLVGLFLFGLSMSFTLLGEVQAQTTRESWIVFRSDRDGNDEIYIMDANGRQVRQLTHTLPSVALEPAWSPDGRKIAFVSGQWKTDIYIMDADGDNIRRLTNDPATDRAPSWSPDGREIVFLSNRSGHSGIYVMGVDGKNVRNLSNHPGDGFPSWSPDGRSIAFDSTREGNRDIYVMDADGGNVRRLTFHPEVDAFPAWSPDSRKMAFVRGLQGIFVMNADGTDPHRIIESGEDPVWSPDGTRIAFATNRLGSHDIYVTDLEGKTLLQLTKDPGYDAQPDWFDPTLPRPVSVKGKRPVLWGRIKQSSR